MSHLKDKYIILTTRHPTYEPISCSVCNKSIEIEEKYVVEIIPFKDDVIYCYEHGIDKLEVVVG